MRTLRRLAFAVALLGLGLVAAWFALPLLSGRLERHIVDRLNGQTGLDWAIRGGIAIRFDPEPHLLVRDLAAHVPDRAEDGTTLTVRQMRLSGESRLLWADDGEGRAVVEGITATVPLDATSASGGGNADRKGTPSGLVSLSGTVKGVGGGLIKGGHIVEAHADSADLRFSVSSQAVQPTAQIDVETAGAVTTLGWEGPPPGQTAGAFHLAMQPRSPDGLRLAAKARTLFDAKGLTLDALQGTIDEAPFAGRARLAPGPKPAVSADLRLSRLTVADDTEFTEERRKDDGLVVAASTLLDIDPHLFDLCDLDAKVDLGAVNIGTVTLNGVKAAFTTADRVLDLALTVDKLDEGSVRARYVLALGDQDSRQHQLSLSLLGSRLSPLLGDMVGAHGLDGTATVRVEVQATGAGADALMRSASGHAEVSAVNGWINGLGLAGLVPFSRTGNEEAGGGALAARFSQISAAFEIGDGKATTNDFQMRTDIADVTGEGVLDLAGHALDMRLTPSLGTHGAGKANRLTVPVHVVGPWSQPTVSADLSGVAAHPEQAIQSLQDLGSGMLGGKGGGLSDLLNAFGGGRRK